MRVAPDVLMVLENSRYPHDCRVRKEAESLVRAGLSVEVLAPREAGRPDREHIRGVQVTRFPLLDGDGALLGTAIEYLAAFLAIATLVLPRLARSRTGTLHVHNPPDFFFGLLWLARRRGWSTVFDHHDDAVGMLRAKLGRATLLDALLAWMRKRSARIADLTIATNDTQRTLLQADARRTVVVRNSPPAWFADHRPSVCDGRARMVFLGELGVLDRVERAVDVLSLLVNDYQVDVELMIIGDGPQRQTVEERAHHLGIYDRVTITGWVPYEEVPALLASAQVGIDTASMTDVNHGSTMIKILEYLAVGLPVVASALRETKITGQNAVIAVDDDRADAFAEPLANLLTDRKAWSNAAGLARSRGNDLHWPPQAARLLDAYPQRGRSQADANFTLTAGEDAHRIGERLG
jgi:glycosyltransferase involved in cell wall biosynthesis